MHKYMMSVEAEIIDHSCKYVFNLPNTAFIAVSAYHSPEISRLKISRNPSVKAHKAMPRKRHSIPQRSARKRPSESSSVTHCKASISDKEDSDSSYKTGSEGSIKDESEDLSQIKNLVSKY